jgi:hypothetical protein
MHVTIDLQFAKKETVSILNICYIKYNSTYKIGFYFLVVFNDIRAVNMTVCWHHLLCFNLVILNFLIWQFTLTRQIDKFKLLSIIFDKSKKICSLIRIPRMT